MITGARQGSLIGIRRLFASAMAKDLKVFVVPGLDIARTHGLDIEASGLQVVASPRHASVLLVIGDLVPAMCEAASIVYSQMLRPRLLFTIGVTDKEVLSPLPEADVSVALSENQSQKNLIDGVREVRAVFKKGAFQTNVKDFDAPALHVRIEYVCPMHPEIVRDEPGDCPKCGMFLVPREAQENSTTAHDEHEKLVSPGADVSAQASDHDHQKTSTEYFCPMHPEVVQDEPGDCPKCGMFLEPRDKTAESKVAESKHEPHEASVEYFCPMHPEVVQNEPGDCPKCGMFLEPREKQDPPTHDHGVTDHDEHNDHADHTDHSDMNHEESGFMSMIEVTRDLPSSRDGLKMEWIDVSFGPFLPGLPSGLRLVFTLDGDAVSAVDTHAITENIKVLEHSPMHGGCFVKHFLTLDPLTPVASQILICQAMENAAGISIDINEEKARIGALERERITSHLNWLVLFAQQTGFLWLARSAASLQLSVANATLKQIAELKPKLQKLIKQINRTPLLKQRTSGIGYIVTEDELCGVIARGSSLDNDVRNDNEVYISLGFKSIKRKEGDAWARLQIRLNEINQSLALIEAAGNIKIPAMINLDEVSGQGQAKIETPRGRVSLLLTMDKGFVSAVTLKTPSTHHLSLLNAITDQQELGDALVAVGSLDLSPWEIRQ